MKITFTALIFFLVSNSVFSQQTDNTELKTMYDEDQKERTGTNIDWEQLNKKDSLRELRVYELIKGGKIITGKDYYHSAMIFQHGGDSVAYGMAVKHMRKAIELDSTINKWLLAAAIDRELMSRDKPQIYGTQYVKDSPDANWELYQIDTTKVTDEERKRFNIKTLAELRERARNMNLLPISPYYTTVGIEKTIALIKKEKAFGAKSSYNVSEEQINNFGYELMNNGKLGDALNIFVLNTDFYPTAFNTFDSLGECLLKLNRIEKGRAAYKKSLELNPGNEHAKSVLSRGK